MRELIPGHRLGFPPALAPIEPDARPMVSITRPRYDEGAKYRQAVAFFEDWRSMRRMNAKSVAIGAPRETGPTDPREASFEDFNETLANDTDAYARLIEMRGGCSCHLHPPCGPCSTALTEDEALTLGWEPPEVAPRFKVGDKVSWSGGPDLALTILGKSVHHEEIWYCTNELGQSGAFLQNELAPLKPVEPQADAEGWIAHDGGLCPEAVVAARERGHAVFVRFRSGEVNELKAAGRPFLNTVFKNLPCDRSLDALAYRVVPA